MILVLMDKAILMFKMVPQLKTKMAKMMMRMLNIQVSMMTQAKRVLIIRVILPIMRMMKARKMIMLMRKIKIVKFLLLKVKLQRLVKIHTPLIKMVILQIKTVRFLKKQKMFLSFLKNLMQMSLPMKMLSILRIFRRLLVMN